MCINAMLFLGSSQGYLEPDVFSLGEGDATGEALGPGLGLFTGVAVAPLGEGAEEAGELTAAGEFELSAFSVAQPAATTIERIVRSKRAVRLTVFMLGVLISFASFQ